MKRRKSVDRPGKKQKVPAFRYIPGAKKQSKEFERLRIASWTNHDDPLLGNRRHILATIEDFIHLRKGYDDFLRNVSFLKLLVYDVGYTWPDGNPPKFDAFETTFDFDLPMLMGGGQSRALLLGIAIVEPWMEENVHKLFELDVFYKDANLEQYFYDGLKKQYRNIVLAGRPERSKLSFWKNLGVLADTKAVWDPRTPYDLGLECDDEVTFERALSRAEVADFHADLGTLFARLRNWILVYLRAVLHCDVPILEAISHAWPEALYPVSLMRSEGGVEFVFPWQLSEERNLVFRRWRIITDVFKNNQNIQLRFGDPYSFTGLPDQQLYAAHFNAPITFRNQKRFQSLIPLLPPLFRKYGIVLRGSTFGSYYGLD